MTIQIRQKISQNYMICEKSEIALNTGCLHRMTTNLTTKTHIYPVVGIFLTTYRGFPDHKSDHEKSRYSGCFSVQNIDFHIFLPRIDIIF